MSKKTRAIKAIIELINNEKFELLTDSDIKKYIRYSMTTSHTGKMLGLCSISTSCKDNTICKERAKNKNSICAKCYAQKQLSYQATTRDKMHTNYLFYTNTDIKPAQVPFINVAYLRLESFGDLQNVQQFKNYCTILENNKHIVSGVLWSKNGNIIRDAINSGINKPEGMKIILSSPMVNHVLTIEDLTELDYISFVDAVFTVFDKDYAAKNNVSITCGSRNCATCKLCYSLKSGKIIFINELLK